MEQFKPSPAFVISSWLALILGASVYFFGLWNADFGLGEKGYYVVLLLFGLYAVISLQKTVRDRIEGIPVSNMYYGVSWLALLLCITLMGIGLWNASFGLGDKGFYAMGFMLSLFAGVAVQKNIRDIAAVDNYMRENDDDYDASGSSFFGRDNKEKEV